MYVGSNAMPVPCSTLPKPERNTDDAALDIVVGLMDKLNKGGRAEEMGERNNSTAMRNINTEMNKMVDYIQSFMKDSLSLVDNEGNTILATRDIGCLMFKPCSIFFRTSLCNL